MTYNLQLKLTACRDVVVAVAVAVVVVDVDVAVAVADGGAVPVILVLDLMKNILCSERRNEKVPCFCVDTLAHFS